MKFNPQESPVPEIDPDEIISYLKKKNNEIQSFRGIGKFFSSFQDHKKIKERIAFMGHLPKSLRVEVLSPFGSVMRFATNGEFLFFSTKNNPKIYRTKYSKNVLNRFIPFSITTEDLLLYICSRIPIYKYTWSEVRKKDNNYILILKKRFGMSQKIYLTEDKKDVLKMELFDRFNRLIYKIKFDKLKKIGAHNIFYKLVITDEKKSNFCLDIKQLQLNVNVTKSQFIIK